MKVAKEGEVAGEKKEKPVKEKKEKIVKGVSDALKKV